MGGDQLLAERVRAIQKQRESDVLGEDFSMVLPVLGPLHTEMNYKKLIMKLFMGEKSGSVVGSLASFNKKLRRKHIDEKASNFWACLDFTRDCADALLLGLMVEESGVNGEKGMESWNEFRAKVKSGDVNWRNIVRNVADILSYRYVDICREERDDMSRDRARENILLFLRMELEFRAFYRAKRDGDVGVMELILQLWGPQFLAGGGSKYGPELMDIRCGMVCEWTEELREIVRRNWVINPRGRSGKCLGLDEFMEELVRAYKQQFNPGGSETTDDFQRNVIARCAIYLMGIKDEVRGGLGLRKKSGNRSKQDTGPDVMALLEKVLEEGVGRMVPGRGREAVDQPGGMKEVDDMMVRGVERMRDGKWWPEFLARSPGCGRVKILRTLGLADQLDIGDEIAIEEEDGRDDGMEADDDE